MVTAAAQDTLQRIRAVERAIFVRGNGFFKACDDAAIDTAARGIVSRKKQFGYAFRSHAEFFPINNGSAHIDGGGLRAVYHMEIGVVCSWRPRGTWPVPNECFVAGFGKNIP